MKKTYVYPWSQLESFLPSGMMMDDIMGGHSGDHNTPPLAPGRNKLYV